MCIFNTVTTTLRYTTQQIDIFKKNYVWILLIFNFNFTLQSNLIVWHKQACCAGCRRRPFPMQIQQKAKSTHSAKSL
jgi:hypothetical protein